MSSPSFPVFQCATKLLFRGSLRLLHTCFFQASLRLPKGTTNAEVKRTTSCLLESFGLAHISKSFIGGPHEAARGYAEYSDCISLA